MSIYEKLKAIQQDTKAPKNLKNTFGGFNYRSAEGILEAVKPQLEKNNCIILLNDAVEQVGDRFYIKARATLIDCESGDTLTTDAYAREPLSKTKMDDAQVTGTSSSYARKYALNGLLLLDDTKDPDTDEYQKQTKDKANDKAAESAKSSRIASKDAVIIKNIIAKKGLTEQSILDNYKIRKIKDMTGEMYINCLSILNKYPDKDKDGA